MLDEPDCSIRKCKHFLGVGSPESDDGDEEEFEINICQAFPDGISEDMPMATTSIPRLHLIKRMRLFMS